MSEEPPKPAAPPPAPGAKTSKLVLILLVLNLGASGFGVFRLMTAMPEASAHGAGTRGSSEAEPSKLVITGPVLNLEPFVVNLDEPGTARYLRVKLQAEMISSEAEAAATKSLLLVRDVVLAHLSGLKLADTLGAQAKDKLRTELLSKLTAAIGPNQIRRLFITEWVVQ